MKTSRWNTFHVRGCLLLAALVVACSGPADTTEQTASPARRPMPENAAVAYVAGGCFWCMEPPFEQLDGVISVVSGYTGGPETDPSYSEVAAGRTGHVEAVRITYDPAIIGYHQLLRVFFKSIDPTDDGGQFADRGTQYRTAIFVADDYERQVAETSRQQLADSGIFRGSIATEPFTIAQHLVVEQGCVHGNRVLIYLVIDTTTPEDHTTCSGTLLL